MLFTYGSKIACVDNVEHPDSQYESISSGDILEPGDELSVFGNWYKIPETAIGIQTCKSNSFMFRRPKENYHD